MFFLIRESRFRRAVAPPRRESENARFGRP
jgi:hypothetical protein